MPTTGDLAGTSVPFTLSLTESIGILRRRRFFGHVRDDAARGGQPERGSVKGVRRRREVEFRKTMPACYVPSPDGSLVTLRKHLHDQGFTELPEVMPPHWIDYRGELTDDGQAMRGTWIISRNLVHSDQGWLDIGGDGASAGTWTAQRRSPQPSAI